MPVIAAKSGLDGSEWRTFRPQSARTSARLSGDAGWQLFLTKGDKKKRAIKAIRVD
jgi:hypothetical protein